MLVQSQQELEQPDAVGETFRAQEVAIGPPSRPRETGYKPISPDTLDNAAMEAEA